MNKNWIQETNEILKMWEARRQEVHSQSEFLRIELEDLDKHIEVMHDAISLYMKAHPDEATATLDNIKLTSLANKTYPEMLIEIAQQSPNEILTIEDVTDILFKANIGLDRNTIRHNVGNTLLRLSHLGQHFAKIGRGQFRFTNHVQGKKLIENKKTKPIKRIRAEPSGVRDAVKVLKDRNPQMTRKEVLNQLEARGFDFHGKNPAKAVTFVWGILGYSKEGKQQLLPMPKPVPEYGFSFVGNND